MRAILKHKKWWHRFVPSKRKELRIQQAILDYITQKPEFQRKVKERVIQELLYGRAE